MDLACGSGTLLAAILTDMKRRAKKQGADETKIAELQRVGVEEVIKGMDINPVSLQLAAAQLTAGNRYVRYKGMGLHKMRYGENCSGRCYAGSLELLAQNAIVAREGELDIPDAEIGSQSVWEQGDNAGLEDAIDAAKDARIVIMNPPFTNRTKMGEKFSKEIQQRLRKRVDAMEQNLIVNDHAYEGFMDKNALRPLFVALADKCLGSARGILTCVTPTTALSSPSGLYERRLLAQRYHIHTVVSSHQPGNVNMSQDSDINESIIIAARHAGTKPPTRFIRLDKMPADGDECEDLHRSLLACDEGPIASGWGEVSYWPAERMEDGDWSPAVWRSPVLAKAASVFANSPDLCAIGECSGVKPHATGQTLRGSFMTADRDTPGAFPILKTSGYKAGQETIQSTPDEWWQTQTRDHTTLNGSRPPEAEQLLQKAGHLLITAGQDSSSARLAATADDEKYVGNRWIPVTGLSIEEAKAAAVFINSTPGRLQIMQNVGKKLAFFTFSAAQAAKLRIASPKNDRIRGVLSNCFENTKDMIVPQFREGECEVRRLWDEAVADAMGWDPEELTRLRHLLHKEPHVRGLGYNQYT